MMKKKYFKSDFNKYSGTGNEICLPTLDFNLLTITDGFQNKALKEMILALSAVGVALGFKRLSFSGSFISQSIKATVEIPTRNLPIAFYDGETIYDICLPNKIKTNDSQLIETIQNKNKIECPVCHRKMSGNKRLFILEDYQLVGTNCLLSKVYPQDELRRVYGLRKTSEAIYMNNLALMKSYVDSSENYHFEYSDYAKATENILKNEIYIPITESILSPEEQKKYYNIIMDDILNALLNKIINDKPFDVKNNYNSAFMINNTNGRILSLMRSIYNGYLSNLSKMFIKELGSKVVKQFAESKIKQPLELEGKIVWGDMGYDNTLPVFYRITKQTSKTVVLERLYSKTYSGNINDVRFFVVPDENNVDKSTKPLRKQIKIDSKGNFYCSIQGRYFGLWDGKPKEESER